MQTLHFDVQGFSRTYWDFYMGFRLFVTVFLLFAAVLAWQLGGLSKETLTLMPAVPWGLAICFVGVTVLSWKYFFIAPVIFSSVITLCLILAAWLSQAHHRGADKIVMSRFGKAPVGKEAASGNEDMDL